MQYGRGAGAALVLCLAAAGVRGESCEDAWAAYNEFRQRNVMEPSQYALTEYGARVRAACGPQALPAPPGTDIPHRPVIRKHYKPPPPDKPRPPPGN